MWAHSHLKMLDKFGNAKKKRNAEETAIFGFVNKLRQGGRVVKALDC